MVLGAVGIEGWAGSNPPSPRESHSALEVAGVRIKERGPRAGREGGASEEEPFCQSLLVHRRESLFLYNGWGWGHCTLLAPSGAL